MIRKTILLPWQHLFVSFMLIAATLATVSAAEPKPSASELEGLLRELRRTRNQLQEERRAFAREQRVLKQLRAQKEARLAALRREHDARRRELDDRRRVRDRQRKQVEQMARLDERVRKHLRQMAEELLALAERQPRLADRKQVDVLTKIAAGEIDPDTEAVLFWNTLLALAVRGVESNLDRRLIEVGGQELAVSTLRLGTISSLWLTADESRGGYSRVKSETGEFMWLEVSADQLPAIVHSFRVAAAEQPAELIRVPIAAEIQREDRTP